MKRLGWITPMLLVALAASFSVAFAHEGEDHPSKTLLGTVKTVKKGKVEIETPDGKKVTVALAADVRYTKDGENITMDAVEPGTRVAMEVSEEEQGKMVCHRMRLGVMEAPSHLGHDGDDSKHDPHRH